MSKLTVVYLKDTGHVLAALTRADPPEGDEPVTALVGTGLAGERHRTAAADVTVPVNVPGCRHRRRRPARGRDQPAEFQVVEDPQDTRHPTGKEFGAPGSTSPSHSTAPRARRHGHDRATATSLPAVVVLQKVTSPSLAPTILAPGHGHR